MYNSGAMFFSGWFGFISGESVEMNAGPHVRAGFLAAQRTPGADVGQGFREADLYEAEVSLGLAAAVFRYAKAHYNDGAWDTIVECRTMADLVPVVSGAVSVRCALDRVVTHYALGARADRQADIGAERF